MNKKKSKAKKKLSAKQSVFNRFAAVLNKSYLTSQVLFSPFPSAEKKSKIKIVIRPQLIQYEKNEIVNHWQVGYYFSKKGIDKNQSFKVLTGRFSEKEAIEAAKQLVDENKHLYF